MVLDSMVCKCGHSKHEHNPPDSWEDEDMENTFCFYERCTCQKYEPICVATPNKPEKEKGE